jgi:thymidylate kinase
MIEKVNVENSELAVNLCASLNMEGVNYCHWKSNAALDRSASGENDLDLLVSKTDSACFIKTLYQMGFIEAFSPAWEKLPGVRDFYGYDGQVDRLIHVHAHFQLVLGHDLSKNYRLPIERAYLESASLNGWIKVPTIEFELVVFVIRMVLKHSTLDTILMLHGFLSHSEERELEFLQQQASFSTVEQILKDNLPFIDMELFKACLQSIQPKSSFLKRIRAGRILQQKLTSTARRSALTDLFVKFTRRVWFPIQSRLHLHFPRKKMANGGLLMAIIGGDGSGKTTAIKGLYNRLYEEFDIYKFHMGKPAWSFSTILIRGIIKIGRTLGFYPFMKEGSQYSIDTTSPEFPGYPWLIREVCTANDRLKAYKKARRLASNGYLVICDRFPLANVKIMDGPQVERVTAGMPSTRMMRYLAKLEKRYYDQILLPDLLAVLRVAPEISVERKTDEPSDSVRSRATEMWNIDWSESPAQIIDASKSKEEVIKSLMTLVWSHL